MRLREPDSDQDALGRIRSVEGRSRSDGRVRQLRSRAGPGIPPQAARRAGGESRPLPDRRRLERNHGSPAEPGHDPAHRRPRGHARPAPQAEPAHQDRRQDHGRRDDGERAAPHVPRGHPRRPRDRGPGQLRRGAGRGGGDQAGRGGRLSARRHLQDRLEHRPGVREHARRHGRLVHRQPRTGRPSTTRWASRRSR